MKKTALIVVVAVLVFAALVVGGNSFYTVPEGQSAALYTFGKLDGVVASSGVHFKAPFVQNTKLIDMREQSIEVPQNAYTKDTQTVENLITKVNYRLDASRIDSLIREVGVEFVYDKLVLPSVLSITRNTIGQYTADELIGHRAEVTQKIQDQLIERLTGRGITLTAFTIQNIDFEDSFEAAVRRKVEAEQKALEAQNQTKEKQELAKQEVISAQAEADAMKAKANAEAYAIRAKAEAEAFAVESIERKLSDAPAYIDYLKATRWDGRLPYVQGGATPVLDLRSALPADAPTAAQE